MHKAGFVNIVGNPNVGKSTLMNSLVGERISIITSKAQTTRHRIMGIVNTDDMQIVYSDTPGVLSPNYKLQESMLNFSQSALVDADILLYVTDVVEMPTKNQGFLDRVASQSVPVLLLINKVDLLKDQKDLERLVEEWHSLLPNAEIIREKILQIYDKEIPYAVEVAVEQFKEDEGHIHIMAIIYVERDSQKGIVIGKGGSALKKVGSLARKDIEAFFEKKVYLELYVKVEKDWRNKENKLKSFGYQLD